LVVRATTRAVLRPKPKNGVAKPTVIFAPGLEESQGQNGVPPMPFPQGPPNRRLRHANQRRSELVRRTEEEGAGEQVGTGIPARP